ncbi:hemicentin-1-like, partial [Ruditapes philippinarum]|uniref:hemicentin-1-like n=1 Tax=Ruditapes philippinarum TaxID=129788 RepID=UPI00295B9BE3
ITPSLQYDNPPSQNQDLVQNAVTYKCSTRCAYPSPKFAWYYNKTSESRQEWSTTAPVTEKNGSCTDSEKIYTSTLTLSRYTVFTDNTDTSVKFQCGAISKTGTEDQLFTQTSANVRFAVLATSPTITDLTTEKLEGDQIKYQCTSSQTRPVAIVTWKLDTLAMTDVQNTEHSHENDLKSVTSIVTFTANRTDNNKTIYCETAIPGQNLVKVQEKITVYWPPVSPVIPTRSFPFLEGQTGKSIYCSSSDYGNPTATATWTTQYGTPDSADTRKLRLPKLTHQVDRSPVNCQLKNLFTQRKGLQIQSKQVLLQVEYSPRVQVLAYGKQLTTITINEGKTLSVTCNATGNPTPAVIWVGQQSSSPTLSFDDIDRADHGNYTCRATATSSHYPSHNFGTEEILAIVVNYAPDVTVSSSTPTENHPFTIKCKLEGRPAEYHFTSFIQKWGSVRIPNTHITNSDVIKIENVQLQDSGTYVCKANNGIRDRNQQLDQSGNNTVDIKVSPKVLLQTTERKFVGQVGLSTNITVPFYCNPRPQTVRFFQNGSVIINSSKHTVTLQKGHVKDIFYGQEVELDGYFAQLEIKNVEESDFVNYTLVIDNGIGSYKSWMIDHIYENKPDVPRNFILAKQLSTESSFTVTWNPGNDNGHKQTFTLKYKKVSDDEWDNVSVSDTGEYEMTYIATGLSSGTYYEIVLYASNMLGNSEESEIILAKTKGKAKIQDCNNGACNNDIKAVIVGIVLGIIIVVVVAYAGYVTILLKRKGENTAGNNSGHPTKLTKNNVPLSSNMVFSTNDGDDQQGTDPDEPGESQYTSLKTELKDDRQTYDVLGV